MSIKGGGLPGADDIADLFGVKPEDRERWRTPQQPKAPSTAKKAFQDSVEAATELASHGVQAKLNAEHQMAARRRTDQGTNRKRTRVITETETVDIEDRDDRTVLDSDSPEF